MSRPLTVQSDWRHLQAQAGNATRVQVDFKSQEFSDGSEKPTRYTEAGPVWLNVFDPAIRPDSKVRVVLNSFYGTNSGMHWQNSPAQVKDLWVPEAGHATVQLDSVLIQASGTGGRFEGTQQLGLVIDGDWKKGADGQDVSLKMQNA